MKKLFFLNLVASLLISLSVSADTIILKNGTRLTGNIVQQNIGKSIVFAISDNGDGTLTIPLSNVLSINYLEEIEKGSDKYYADITLKNPEGKTYSKVLLVEKNYDNVIFQVNQPKEVQKRTIAISDIAVLKRDFKQNKVGLVDELEFADGSRETGQITEQNYGKNITVTNTTGNHTYALGSVVIQRKVKTNTNMSLLDLADEFDEVRLSNGDVLRGVIYEQGWKSGVLKLYTVADQERELNVSNVVSIVKVKK